MRAAWSTISLAAGIAAAAAPAHAQTAANGGAYVGIAAGIALEADDSSGAVTFDRGGNGSFGETVTTSGGADAFSPGFCSGAALTNAVAGGCSADGNDYDIGLRAGYDWPMGGAFLVGGVVEVSKNGITDNITAFSVTPAAYTFVRSSDYVAAVRGRIGLATGMGLVYATGGFAASKMDNSFTTTNAANSFTQNNADDWAKGYQAGGGFEFGLSQALSLGLEYLYNDFKDDDYSVSVGTGTAGATNPFVLAGGVDMKPDDEHFTYHSVRATLSFGF